MRKSSFFIACFFLLVLLDQFGATLDFKLKFGIIVETCFNKTKKFEDKLSAVRKTNGSANVVVVDAPCGNAVAAREQVCSLIENDGVNLFVALATKPLQDFYEMAFNALKGPKIINSDVETVISDIADEFEWNNIFIYVDTVYGDVMPICSAKSMNTKSCHSVMVWRNNETPEAFINQTLFYKNGKKIVHMQTNHYVLILSAHDTVEVVRIAQQKKLFNYRNEWLIFAGPEVAQIMKALRCLKYGSNVYVARIKGGNDTQEIIRNILTIRNEWKDNYRSTYEIIRSSHIKHVCGDIKTNAGIKSDVTSYTSVFEISEVIPTRFDADPSLHLLGRWSVNGNPRYRNEFVRKIPNFEGVKLKVATLQTPPYVSVKKSNSSDSFSGYLVDMLDIAAENLNFTYELFAVEDNEYGQEKCHNGTCRWTGVIGAVQRGEADIALANLTPLADRAKAVMFLHAALATGGFKMIYLKPTIYDKSSNLWAYVRPFTYRTWICVIVMMLVMVFLLSVNQKIKWRNAGGMSKGFNIDNPVFVAVQILCQQGLDDTPKDSSGRIFFIVMWLFSVLGFASYAATLTSYFTTAELKLPIKNLDEFLKQTEYKLAFKTGSAYLTLMKSPNAPEEYRRLNERIQKDVKNSFVSNIDEGFERITKEKLIFAHDRVTLIWHESLSCNLIVVGPTYMKVGVTIATNHGSQYYRGLDWALRILNEGGFARRAQKEHWGSKAECHLKNNQFQPVTILTVITPLLILLAGLGGAILIAPFEGFYGWIQRERCKPPPTKTIRKRHVVEASKKSFTNIRTFAQKNGVRRSVLSNRRSPRTMTLFL